MGSSSSEDYNKPETSPINSTARANRPVPPPSNMPVSNYTNFLPSDPTQMATGLTPDMMEAIGLAAAAQGAAPAQAAGAGRGMGGDANARRDMLAQAIADALAKQQAEEEARSFDPHYNNSNKDLFSSSGGTYR